MFDARDLQDEIYGHVHDHVITGHFWSLAQIVTRFMGHPEVRAAKDEALAAGVPWDQIIAALMPFALDISTGGWIDWIGIINALVALFGRPPADQPAAD
jgi:hypothetical protein